jgi:periplasmic protein TonB
MYAVPYTQTLWKSSVVHAALIAGLFASSLLRGCLHSVPPPRDIIALDMNSVLPNRGSPNSKLTAPPKPKPPEPKPPEPAPKPEVVEPEPSKDEIPDLTKPPPKPDKPKVEISKVKVRRPADAAPAPKAPKQRPPTAAEIKAMLEGGLPRGVDHGPTGAGLPNDWYLTYVRDTMHDAWLQPGGLAASAGLAASVKIRVMRDGSIASRALVRPSGNTMLDDSAMKAVQSVPRLRPLPSDYREPYRDITIAFQLEGML